MIGPAGISIMLRDDIRALADVARRRAILFNFHVCGSHHGAPFAAGPDWGCHPAPM